MCSLGKEHFEHLSDKSFDLWMLRELEDLSHYTGSVILIKKRILFLTYISWRLAILIVWEDFFFVLWVKPTLMRQLLRKKNAERVGPLHRFIQGLNDGP